MRRQGGLEPPASRLGRCNSKLSEMMKGAEALVKIMEDQGVEVIFGIPGGALIPLEDVLLDSKIRRLLTRHEQGAAHMADGYARASGKVGVCMATSGPGATNLVTGLATAQMDSVPIVAITGQVATTMIGNDAFQEADTYGITMPITKHSWLVKDARELPRIALEAFHIARTGRPGVVLIDLPVNVSKADLEFEYPTLDNLRGYRPTYKGHGKQIKLAADAIAQAQRPILYIGGGVVSSGADQELVEFAEKANLPVINSLMAKGAFPEDHPLSLGMPGMHGAAYANYATTHCDLIVGIGTRFDDRVTGKLSKFAPEAKIIHIDIDPAEISKNIEAYIPIVGDAKAVLQQLTARIEPQNNESWWRQLDEWKKQHPLTYKHREDGVTPEYVVEQICEATGGEAIVATEVGQNQMWAAQYYKCKRPRQFLTSGGLGTMGYGFPAAIGAQIARPDAVVFDIAGDGSIQMNIQELATAVENRLPVKVAILNNGYLGMVRQWQELFWHKRYASVDLSGSPDFTKVAEAFGAVGICIERDEDVRAAIDKSLEIDDRPTFLDFHISREANVFPMVPAGAGAAEMLTDEKEAEPDAMRLAREARKNP